MDAHRKTECSDAIHDSFVEIDELSPLDRERRFSESGNEGLLCLDEWIARILDQPPNQAHSALYPGNEAKRQQDFGPMLASPGKFREQMNDLIGIEQLCQRKVGALIAFEEKTSSLGLARGDQDRAAMGD